MLPSVGEHVPGRRRSCVDSGLDSSRRGNGVLIRAGLGAMTKATGLPSFPQECCAGSLSHDGFSCVNTTSPNSEQSVHYIDVEDEESMAVNRQIPQTWVVIENKHRLA